MIDYLNYGKQVQSISKEPRSEIKICTPKLSHGWLEYKLNTQEMNYVWKCIDTKLGKVNDKLAGNITGSFSLEDKNDWFFNNTLTPLINSYENTFENLGRKVADYSDGNTPIQYAMNTWWINYQKQYEFNPSHNHRGVYSFVIWMKIPYEYEEQNKDNKSNAKARGTFVFEYTNLLGELVSTDYKLGKKHEGTMVLFSSKLKHQVYPFYNCEEERISVSGNIFLNV
tara:strand:- start:10 stop:687 length:678 start_codon:yes stop_codon:yes gene_type:complete